MLMQASGCIMFANVSWTKVNSMIKRKENVEGDDKKHGHVNAKFNDGVTITMISFLLLL